MELQKEIQEALEVSVYEMKMGMMQEKVMSIKYILREENKLADHLANLALEKENICVNNFQ